MTQELERVIAKLEALPQEEQRRWAVALLERLEKEEALRQVISEAEQDVARGDVAPFDAEDIIRRGKARYTSQRED